MKKIEITCDFCEKYIDDKMHYATLLVPLYPELNFCGYSCFHDWMKRMCNNIKDS
jgi:hypothetical protein